MRTEMKRNAYMQRACEYGNYVCNKSSSKQQQQKLHIHMSKTTEMKKEWEK